MRKLVGLTLLFILIPLGENSLAQQNLPASDIWQSREVCDALISKGERLNNGTTGNIRLATWNIRWFPRGCMPGEQCPDKETDIDWLACTIVWMGVDIIAVQEFMSDYTGRKGADELKRTLDRLTGGKWKLELQLCGTNKSHKIGYLWNSAKVKLSGFADVSELSGIGAPEGKCPGGIKPGRFAIAELPTGEEIGLITVHYHPGRPISDYNIRRSASSKMDSLKPGGTSFEYITDKVIMLGDFNTMGHDATANIQEVTKEGELEVLMSQSEPAFIRPQTDQECTMYFNGTPENLDHIFVTPELEKKVSSARIQGFCPIIDCKIKSEDDIHPAYKNLSDHCPVLIDVKM